jgi:hypothetical protein
MPIGILGSLLICTKLFVVLAFIVFGVGYVTPANWHPFVPDNTGTFGQFGWTGIMRGAAVVFFAFIGFDAVSTAAQEAKNPQTDMPIGILGSLLICTILYVAVAGVLTGLVPYTELGVPDPIAEAVDVIGLTWFSVLIKNRSALRPHHGDPGAALWPEPHLLPDRQGRPAAQNVLRCASLARYAQQEPASDWYHRGRRRGADPHRYPR